MVPRSFGGVPAMGRVIIVQGADRESHRETVCTERRARSLGYEYRRYHLGHNTTPDGREWDLKPGDLEKHAGFIPCHFKPQIIMDALLKTKPGDYVVYLDTDVALKRDLVLAEAMPSGTVGCSLRPLSERDTSREVGQINTGILIFRSPAQEIVG